MLVIRNSLLFHCLKQGDSRLPCVNASSRNGTLGTHPSCTPKVENVFQKVLNITFLKHFSYFFNKGAQILILFIYFGQFPTFDVQKVPLVLDAFTCVYCSYSFFPTGHCCTKAQ